MLVDTNSQVVGNKAPKIFGEKVGKCVDNRGAGIRNGLRSFGSCRYLEMDENGAAASTESPAILAQCVHDQPGKSNLRTCHKAEREHPPRHEEHPRQRHDQISANPFRHRVKRLNVNTGGVVKRVGAVYQTHTKEYGLGSSCRIRCRNAPDDGAQVRYEQEHSATRIFAVEPRQVAEMNENNLQSGCLCTTIAGRARNTAWWERTGQVSNHSAYLIQGAADPLTWYIIAGDSYSSRSSIRTLRAARSRKH